MGGSLTERALAIGFAKIRTRPAQPQGDEKRLLKAAEELRLGRLGAAAANIAALEVRKLLRPFCFCWLVSGAEPRRSCGWRQDKRAAHVCAAWLAEAQRRLVVEQASPEQPNLPLCPCPATDHGWLCAGGGGA